MGKIFSRELDENSAEYLKACKENQDYNNQHIANVQKAFHTIIKPVFIENPLPGYTQEETNEIFQIAEAYVKNHDKSKYTDDEFPYYRQHFYPTEKEKNATREEIEEMDRLFDLAWRHHFTHNDHHPQFWCNCIITKTYKYGAPLKYKVLPSKGDLHDMSIVSIVHMISDWTAMGIPHGNPSPWHWYNTDAKTEKDSMTDNTKKIVEAIMTMVFPPEKEEGDN